MTPGEFWWSELTISTTDHVIFVIRPELHNIETIKYVLCLWGMMRMIVTVTREFMFHKDREELQHTEGDPAVVLQKVPSEGS